MEVNVNNCMEIVKRMHKRQKTRETSNRFRKLYYSNPCKWVEWTGNSHPDLTFEENRAILQGVGKW